MSNNPMQRQPQSPSVDVWHMKKEVNVAHVITTLSLFVGGFWFLSGLDKRIEVNTKDIIYIQQQRAEDVKRQEKQFDRINSKLDKILAK